MNAPRFRSLLGLLLALALGCGGAPPPPGASRAKPPQKAAASEPRLPGPEGLDAVVVAELAGDADVLFAHRGADGMLLVRRRGRWLAGPVRVGGDRAVSAADAERGMREIAAAPGEASPAALTAHGDGFLMVWAEPGDGGDALWMLRLARDGSLLGDPVEIGPRKGDVRWIELMASDRASFAVWETKPPGQPNAASELSVVAIAGADPSPARLAAREVGGWHAAAGAAGLAVGAVVGARDGRGRVALVRVTPSGEVSDPKIVQDEPTALLDVQVAALADGTLLAWTDAGARDHHVVAAHIDAAGVVSGPRPAVAPVGNQALVALVAGGGARALLAWEESPGASDPRSVHFGLLGSELEPAAPRAELELPGTSNPHAVADGRGFALLTLAPMLRDGGEEGHVAPTYVRLDEQLRVRAAEPVRVSALADRGVLPGVPEQVHGLSCQQGRCTLLAEAHGAPNLLLLVRLPERQGPWQSPVRAIESTPPARAAELALLAEIDEPLAEVATARLRDGRSLVAWVTHRPPDGQGQAPPTAKLQYRLIGKDGRPGPVHTLSTRAVSIGGVAVLALPEKMGERREDAVAVLGWAGPNAGSTQVFLTAIDAAGKKLRQKTVTKIRRKKDSEVPDEVFNVALALDGRGGLLCAWSDTRDGDLEVYVARTGRDLEKVQAERRITDHPGASTEVSLAASGDRVLLAWSDARDGSGADIFVRSLSSSLEPLDEERRIEASPVHSRTPRWVGSAGALALAWIDEPGESPGALRLMAVDDSGQPRTAARRIRLEGLPVTSAAVGCTPERCRGVLAAAGGDALRFGVFEAPRDSGAPLRAEPLATLAGAARQDVSLVTATPELIEVFFARDGSAGGEVRRLRLGW